MIAMVILKRFQIPNSKFHSSLCGRFGGAKVKTKRDAPPILVKFQCDFKDLNLINVLRRTCKPKLAAYLGVEMGSR
jgi:hypothetical protein